MSANLGGSSRVWLPDSFLSDLDVDRTNFPLSCYRFRSSHAYNPLTHRRNAKDKVCNFVCRQLLKTLWYYKWLQQGTNVPFLFRTHLIILIYKILNQLTIWVFLHGVNRPSFNFYNQCV